MTQPPVPNPDNEPESNENPPASPTPPPRRRRRRWLWVALSAFTILGGGLTIGWFILKQQLSPIISGILTEELNRPLNLGPTNYLTLSGIRFGKSELPPTEIDTDRATVEGVNVTFDLFKLLTDRTLALNLTLIEPDAYIEQDVNGEWIATRLPDREGESQWKVDVQTIRVRDADVTLVARNPATETLNSPVKLIVPTARVRTGEQYDFLEGEARGRFERGGKFNVAGSLRLSTLQGKLSLVTQQLNLPYLSRLINVPIIVGSGTLGTNLDIELKGDPRQEFPLARGTATLENLSAKLDEEAIGLDDPQQRAIEKRTAQPREIEERSPFYFLNNLPIAIPNITETDAQLLFQGEKVQIDSLTTQLGQINAAVEGTIDRNAGFDLQATTEPVRIAQLLNTFELEPPPIPVAGEFKVALQLKGPFDKAIATGNLISTQRVRLDRVSFRNASAKVAFSFDDLTLVVQQLQANPLVGGTVTGNGRVRFNRDRDPGELSFNIQTENVPGDAIASLYLDELPVRIGPVDLQARVSGPLTKIEDLEARVFTRLAGGGTVLARNVRVRDRRFSGNILATALQLDRLLPANSPLRSQVGTANARLDVSGPVENFSLNQLIARGAVTATVAGGTVAARDLQLANGLFSTQLSATGVQTGPLAQSLLPPNLSLPPLGALNGNLQVSGRLGENPAGLPFTGLNGGGSLQVAVAGGTVEAREIELDGDRWRAQVAANGIDSDRVASILTLPPALENIQRSLGAFSGNFRVGGSLNTLNPNTLTANGTGRVNVAGGTANLSANLNRGNFTANIAPNNVRLDRLAAGLSLPPILARQRSALGAFAGNIRIQGNINSLNPQTLTARATGRANIAGGTADINATLNRGNFTANIAPNNVRLDRLAAGLSLPPILARQRSALGAFAGNIRIQGNINSLNPQTLTARATGRANVAGGTADINATLNRGNFTANIAPNNIRLGRFAAELPLPPVLARSRSELGAFAGNIRIQGNVNSLDPQNLTARATGRANIAGGTADLTATLDGGNFIANIAPNNVQLDRFAAQLPLPPALARSRSALGSLGGNFRLQGNLASFNAQTLTATGTGQANVAGGRTDFALDLNRGNWELDVIASDIQLQRLVAGIPAQLQTPVRGNLNLSGTLDNLSLNAIAARGFGLIDLAGGTLAANNIRLANGNLQATLIPNDIQLGQLVEALDGTVSGNIDVSAALANLTPAGIRARGNVNLGDGVLPLEGPIAATFNWDGDRARIERATGPGLDATGFVDINTAALGRGQLGLNLIQRFNFDVALNGLNLEQLAEQGRQLIPLPENIAAIVNSTEISGFADFDGTIAGTLRSPNIDGTLALRDAQFSEFVLDPLVSGPIALTPGEGGSIDLSGTDDKIQVALAPDYKPNSFLIQLDDLFATGTRQGDLLAIETRNVPLALVRQAIPNALIPAQIAAQPLSGQLEGKFNVNLETLAASGQIAIDDPIFSRLSGDRLTLNFQYADGAGLIQDAIFQLGETQYLLDGRVIQTARGPEFDAQVVLKDGRIQDILATAQIFDIADFAQLLQLPTYGNAGDLSTVAVDVGQLPLIAQLRRLSEIEALLETRQRERLEASFLPPLSEAKGDVTGQINLSGSLQEGVEIAFDFDGSDWIWGPFIAEETVARGSFQDGVLTVRPFQMQLARGGGISFAGAIGGETQSGQLIVEDLPVALVQELVPLPPDIGFTGTIDATAFLSGTQTNPQARGQLTVVDATLNQQIVEATEGSFLYNEGLLNFSATSILATDTEPLTIAGTFPYKFPLPNAVAPSSDGFELALNLQDDGLSVLNALTRQQLIWEAGQGRVNLAIAGRYDQEENRLLDLQADGIVDLQDAVISSLLLADSLQDINGQIRFDFNQLTVENLTGELGGGNVAASGSLALTEGTSPENPLTLVLNGLAVNLKGLYNGDVGGDLQVTGALLRPNLSGQLRLSDGRVLIAGLATFGGRDRFVGAREQAGSAGFGGIVAATEFNDLELILDEGLRLEQPFLANLGAEGSILLNGQVGAIAPQGTVNIVNGQINLFTTQLRVRGGYDNVAIFEPEFGLNPQLDLRLVGTVVEATRTPTSADPFSTEIQESLVNVGTLESIRVEAIVDGFALDLLDSLRVEPGEASAQKVRSVLELASTPPRSETQIIALLGGSFINAFSQQDAGLGLANLAGSALLGTIQNSLAESLGLSEFRIFPSIVPDSDDRASAFGIAAELGYNITDDLGVSVTQFLTPQVPTQVNLRYRLDDYILLRGSTNFDEEYRFQVEYRRRF
ncbi:MAG: translocation/assembly module TamB domain-containing protein [Cyanobacteriota bacterium]|nr:translocation/assembly module TamB domain-containing protein [Cyanobacteriota bacterium]